MHNGEGAKTFKLTIFAIFGPKWPWPWNGSHGILSMYHLLTSTYLHIKFCWNWKNLPCVDVGLT